MDSSRESDHFMNEKEDRLRNGRSEDDTSEYSASLAPETGREARRQSRRGDERVTPGGETGAESNVGMPGMDRQDVPTEAEDTGLTRYGDTSEE